MARPQATRSQRPLAKLRTMCMAYPEAHEKVFGGHTIPTFRVRDKIFAQYEESEGRPAVWCKAAPGAQAVLVGADPGRFFVPPYIGHAGWVGVRLDGAVDWEHLAEMIEESYRLIAPKRLLALLDVR